ncbi:hydrogenase formation protein HypD [Magnetospirillum molischianum]|uniref:Hydrogenase maturation factor n=1 Tax=Magnetospirillum molischianum DSM 120 TaxID=1150626 RepID=H8FMT9_MAGML|nr:hydrogenase formation protein HypD [Magnetospirillum molischianum]CCG39677.1 hydrogenase expression/formation protein [Magnetospirillum molischianum DSM 120]
MKHVGEYRDGALAQGIAAAIRAEADPMRSYRLMEFCGGHTHAIARYGLEDLLPPQVRMIHGPGCPVCVLPVGRIDAAIRLAASPEITLCTYGDLMRVPGSNGDSLLKAKAAGADIRMVYSTLDAVGIAEREPTREVVFFAIGFETTSPPTAMAIRLAAQSGLSNFSIFCNHVLTPAAIRAIVAGPEARRDGVKIDGFVGPAHVSTVIGADAYAFCATEFAKPVAIAGFEPLDVLQAVLMLVRQVNQGRHEIENQYIRAVTANGNRKAQALVAEMFEPREAFEWRGLGALPHSGLRLRPAWSRFDAETRFEIETVAAADHPGCACGAVLRGVKRPEECRLFGVACTPDSPIGACMVSSEGACAAQWSYGRFRSPAASVAAERVPA